MPFETPNGLTEAHVAAGLHLIGSGLNRKVGNDTILVFHRVLDREGVTPHQFESAIRDYLREEDQFPSPSKLLRYAKGGDGGQGRAGEAFMLGTTIRFIDYIADPERYAVVMCQRESELREAAAKERALRAALELTSEKRIDAEHIPEPRDADRAGRSASEGLQDEGGQAGRVVLAGSELEPQAPERRVDATDGLDPVQSFLPKPDREACPF